MLADTLAFFTAKAVPWLGGGVMTGDPLALIVVGINLVAFYATVRGKRYYLDQLNWLPGLALLFCGFCLLTAGRDPAQNQQWLYATVTTAPAILVLTVRNGIRHMIAYRNLAEVPRLMTEAWPDDEKEPIKSQDAFEKGDFVFLVGSLYFAQKYSALDIVTATIVALLPIVAATSSPNVMTQWGYNSILACAILGLLWLLPHRTAIWPRRKPFPPRILARWRDRETATATRQPVGTGEEI